MSHQSDQVSIKKLINDIERKIDFENSEVWTHRNYQKLSDLIFDKTGENLSTTTLKRIWGKVKAQTSISITTLNILCQFVGYKDWTEYSESIQISEPVLEKKEIKTSKKHESQIPLISILTVIFFLTIGLLVYIVLVDTQKNNDNLLVFEKSIKNSEPFVVEFYYDIDYQRNKVSNFITYGDGTLDNIELDKHKTKHIYNFPGVYYAKIYIAKELKKTIPVLYPTSDWYSFYSKNFENETKLKQNKMSINKNNINELGKISGDSSLYCTLINFKKYRIEPDSSFVEFCFRNKKSNSFSNISLFLIGDSSRLIIHLRDKKSKREAFLKFGKKHIYTNPIDYPEFYIDFKEFDTLKMNIRNKNIDIKTPKNEYRSFYADKKLGQLLGVQISFYGYFEVDFLRIKELNNRNSFDVDF